MRHIHTRSRFTLAMIGLAALGALTLPASVQAQSCDDFNDGNDDGWMRWTIPADLPGASWDASTGVYRLSAESGDPNGVPPFSTVASQLEISADPVFANGYWRATVVRENEGTLIALTMRTDVESISAYVFVCETSFGLYIGKAEFGHVDELASDEDFVQELGMEYVLEAGAFNTCSDDVELEIRMWPVGDDRPANPQAYYLDHVDPYMSGTNGVLSRTMFWYHGDLSGTFDDVCFEPYTPADIDTDGDVDLTDLGALLAAYGTCDPNDPDPADLDCSGCVDLTDLGMLLADYGYGT